MILRRVEHLAADRRRFWAAARVWAAHQAPYMASALLALDPVVVDQSEDPPAGRFDLGSLPVDARWHVYLDPEILEVMDVPTAGFWLIHQVSHLLRHHADRYPGGGDGSPDPVSRRTRAQQCWNVSADCEINDDLVAGSAVMPLTAQHPATLGLRDSLTAEEYWDLLGGHEDAGDQPHRNASGSDVDCGSGCDGTPSRRCSP